jgi:hypothetical protein
MISASEILRKERQPRSRTGAMPSNHRSDGAATLNCLSSGHVINGQTGKSLTIKNKNLLYRHTEDSGNVMGQLQ